VKTREPSGKSFGFRSQLAGLLLLLAGIAVLMGLQRPEAKVAVSGLTLSAHRSEVLKKLGQPSFQQASPEATRLEYWSDPKVVETAEAPLRYPSLSLDFDAHGRMLRMTGGHPQIDGENVRKWSLDQVERALGPAEGASRGQSLGSGGSVISGDRFLKYPARHLLVTWNPESGVDFMLFAGKR
jgi:hypothetical protein